MDLSGNEHPDSSGNQQDAGDASAARADWCELFERHESRERCDDREIHDAAHEQQQHQSPAAADTKNAVLEAETKCASHPWAPSAHQESKRRLAGSQARVLDRW